MVLLTFVQARYTQYQLSSTEFTSASHSVKPGLIGKYDFFFSLDFLISAKSSDSLLTAGVTLASGIASAWTWR